MASLLGYNFHCMDTFVIYLKIRLIEAAPLCAEPDLNSGKCPKPVTLMGAAQVMVKELYAKFSWQLFYVVIIHS